jgi:8-oxo-dGTP pyrophosphatase MutT (NUDIX family)
MDKIWKPNVTVAAIINRKQHYLMVEELTADGIRYNQPAGHLDPGESLIDAVVRETLEETAHPFVPSGLLGTYLAHAGQGSQAGTTYLRFAFVGQVGEPDPNRALDEGIVRALWMSFEELQATQASHRSPMVLQCVLDHRSARPIGSLDLVYTHLSALAK